MESNVDYRMGILNLDGLCLHCTVSRLDSSPLGRQMPYIRHPSFFYSLGPTHTVFAPQSWSNTNDLMGPKLGLNG